MGRADSGCIDIGFGFPITLIISPINPELSGAMQLLSGNA